MLEMYRRDHFREDLIREHCAELLTLESRLHEVDAMLAAARARTTLGRCSCGTPLYYGSHF